MKKNKFNLQLFSSKQGDTQPEVDNTEKNEVAENEVTEDNTVNEKTFTQKELDEIIEKRLKREREKFDTRVKDLISEDKKEAERLANLTAEERAKELAQQKEEELNKTKAELNKLLLEKETLTRLSEENLPSEFLKIVQADTAEEINENIKSLKEQFSKSVQEAVNERLKGKTPRIATTTKTHGGMNIADYAEKTRLIK